MLIGIQLKLEINILGFIYIGQVLIKSDKIRAVSPLFHWQFQSEEASFWDENKTNSVHTI
jgi:hypothetical protein